MSAKTQQFQAAGSNLRDTVAQTMNMIRGKDVSGFTLYYIDGTSKQPPGSSENLFMPHVTIGRGAKCHIRVGEQHKTVSREHASISTEGSRHVLNHNPGATNPTFVNGQPISGPYYLNNGDEMQFSAQGPKIRYNVQSTPKSSTMGLTSRIGSAVGQAVKPYKTALSVLGLLLLGSIAFGGYTFVEGQETKEELVKTNDALDKANSDRIANRLALEENERLLKAQNEEMIRMEEEMKKASEAKAKTIQAQMAAERKRREALQAQIAERKQKEQELQRLIVQMGQGGKGSNTGDESIVENENSIEQEKVLDSNYPLRVFDNDVYFIKVKNIKVNIEGYAMLDIVKQYNLNWSGTGFLTNEGKFVTARHVLEGWKWFDPVEDKDGNCTGIKGLPPVLQELNKYDASNNVTVVYEATSPRGDNLTFTNKMVKFDNSADEIACNKFNRVPWEAVYTDWATIDFPNRQGISKIKLNRNFSTELKKGLELNISGYARGSALQGNNLDPLYSKAIVAQDNLVDEVINFTGMSIDSGQSGGPCFVKNSKTGQFEAIGIVHGRFGNIGRIVPIWYTR